MRKRGSGPEAANCAALGATPGWPAATERIKKETPPTQQYPTSCNLQHASKRGTGANSGEVAEVRCNATHQLRRRLPIKNDRAASKNKPRGEALQQLHSGFRLGLQLRHGRSSRFSCFFSFWHTASMYRPSCLTGTCSHAVKDQRFRLHAHPLQHIPRRTPPEPGLPPGSPTPTLVPYVYTCRQLLSAANQHQQPRRQCRAGAPGQTRTIPHQPLATTLFP